MQTYRQYHALAARLRFQSRQHQKKGPNPSLHYHSFVENQASESSSRGSSQGQSDIEYEGLHLHETSESLHGTSTRLANALPGIIEDDSHPTKTFLVKFEGPDDPLCPRNWSRTKRILYTFNVGLIALVVGTAASIDSAVIPQAAADFRVSEIVEALATGLFLCGFGIGALIAGPLSETVGRNPVYLGSLTLYMFFIMGAGLSHSIEGQLICRFLAGFCGEAPLSTVGGSISDLWDPLHRLIAFPIFATFGLMGPLMGPIIGGFISESHLVSWRWTEWTTLIMSGTLLSSLFLFQPETYESILLKWKAHHLRRITKDGRFKAPCELDSQATFPRRMQMALKRPFLMIIQEPTIMLWTGYLTVIYIMLFGFLDGYTYVFQDTYSLSPGITGLLFVGIAVGLTLASVVLTPLVFRWAKKEINNLKSRESGELSRLPPEFFLWYAMLGAPAIPISCFWMGWTAYASISIWSPIAASVLFGFGILSVFLSTYLYLIDTYEVYAASALTMITLVRYVVSGGIIEASIPMYENLGVHWTLTLLGSIGVTFTFVPYMFYKFGPQVRSKSGFAKTT
ncbi:uncharacterized protein PV06_02865 [Exophiala oligosperma]|uniref:Major facilitator superfamily (MFS) profile domain-containing protein n=2 Tax=Chaetothyriales TaxID=34395 RepID=A0A0D2EH51_9EURO|nr:uncharacterized protein PV06_02865 [Exophiala oligosperma]KAJ9635640.1 hypothetical protein H2204_005814 [Knufia peltigerae]KIW47284.1 hypothetical protein PV06_02865 [Exophiala oligosperma]